MHAVTPFRNRDNFAKYLLLHYEPGSNVLLTIFRWLYRGSTPPEEHLFRTLKKEVMKGDKIMLEKLKENKIQFHQLDFSLLFAIIKHTCGLKSPDDEVWTRNCPLTKVDELEHLIFVLKQSRNEGAHPSDEHKNLTDACIDRKVQEIFSLSRTILKKAGEKGKIEDQRIDTEIRAIKDQIDRICCDPNLDEKLNPHLCQLIKRDLKETHESYLKSIFDNELKAFSKPYLSRKQQYQPVPTTSDSVFTNEPLDSIFSLFDQHDSIVVEGGAGYGKSSLIKFLFKSWLCDVGDETLRDLDSFQIVFYIQCSRMNTRSISEFLESELPIASFSFSNTTSLRKQMKKSRILWLMDGYDEATAEAKGFLREILESLSSNHKLIVTNRNYNSDLHKIIQNQCVSLKLLPLTDGNINEILNKMVDKIESRDEMKKRFRDLSLTISEDLLTPLTLSLFISTWSEKVEFVEGNALTQLYKRDHEMKIRILRTRLENKTSLTGEELDDKITFWVRYLWFQSCKLLARRSIRIVDKEAEKELKNHPTMQFLVYFECISTFLSTREGSGARFEFTHLMQQYYYSALYLKHILVKGSKIEPEYEEFYADQSLSHCHYIDHYREILKCLANILRSEQLLTTEAYIICMAIETYRDGNALNRINILLEVLESVDFDENLAKSLGKWFNDDLWWDLDERHLKAALCLFNYYQPNEIILDLHDEELSLIYLPQFLDQLSHFPTISVRLLLWKIRGVDAFPKNSNPINLTTFRYTHSDPPDFSWLEFNCENLQFLSLILTDPDSYDKCLKVVKKARLLEHIELILDFRFWENPLEIDHYPLHRRSITVLFIRHYQDQYFDAFTKALDRLCDFKEPFVDQSFLRIFIVLELGIDINDERLLAKIGDKAKVVKLQKKGQLTRQRTFKLQNVDVQQYTQINLYRCDPNLDEKMSPHLCQLIKRDLKGNHENYLISIFDNELKAFSKPFLSRKQQYQSVSTTSDSVFTNEPLDSIFSLFDQHNSIVVEGGAGYGKSSLIKFLFKSWLCDEGDETLRDLDSFQIVFYIQCSRMITGSICEFLESELPFASFSLSNTSSLRILMKKSRILWLMDGYDEATTEAKGFLREILKSLSSNHKLIVTNRNNNSDLHKIIQNRCVSLKLLPLTDGNIHEILNKMVDKIESRDEMKKKFRDLSQTISEDLLTPLTLTLFISTWSESVEFVGGNALIQLYKRDHEMKIRILRTRLKKKTSLTGEELDDKITFWVRYLWFQSCKLLARRSIRIVDEEAEKELKNHPTMQFLVYFECISTFLSTADGSGVRFEFTHLMQQYYYSALYLKHILVKGSKIEPEYEEFYANQSLSHCDDIDHYREILKCLANILRSEQLLTTEAYIICMAIETYRDRNTWNRINILLEVLESVDFDENVAKSFGKWFKDDFWDFDERYLKAALCLFKYYQPKEIEFDLNDEELSIIHLPQFLDQLSHFPTVKVRLLFWKLRGVDDFPKNSNPINLTAFRYTHSVPPDFSWLEFNCENLQFLSLTLTGTDSYDKCLKVVKKARFLERVKLIFDFIFWENPLEIDHYPLHHRSITSLYICHYQDQYFDAFTKALDRLCDFKEPFVDQSFLQIVIVLEQGIDINDERLIAKIDDKATGVMFIKKGKR